MGINLVIRKRAVGRSSCLYRPYKPVHSVDESYTDTFEARKTDNELLAPNIFRVNDSIPKIKLKTNDPGCGFSQEWFNKIESHDSIPVRLD